MEVHITLDFIDDLNRAEGTWDEAALRSMVRDLAQRGVAAIHWIDHGRFDNGIWDEGSYLGRSGNAPRFAREVPDPLRAMKRTGTVCASLRSSSLGTLRSGRHSTPCR